jgi:MraZ protein
MFLGKSNLTLDAKGRIAIPARYREQLFELCDGKMVVTYNPAEKCLPIYPYEEWRQCVRKMQAAPDQSPKVRKLQRLIYSFTHEVDMDASGRLLIPQDSREEVGLSKNAVLIGHGEKLELWDEESWLRVSKEESKELIETIVSDEELDKLGFQL